MSLLTINIPVACNSSDSLPYQFGNREDYLNFGVPLYLAASTGDWEKAKIIFLKHPEFVRFGLSKNLGTALHVAVTPDLYKMTKKNINFVKNLVDMMTADELELKNKDSNTAFWVAAAFGEMEVAKIMLEKNHNLLNIRGSDGVLPISVSALTGEYSTIVYLYNLSNKMCDDHWTDRDRDLTLLNCVETDVFDVALQILKDRPELARNVSILTLLAPKRYAFRSYKIKIINRITLATARVWSSKVQPAADEDTNAMKILKIIWEHATRTMDIDGIEDILRVPPRILFVAAKKGNTKFVVELLRTYPDLMLDTNEDGLSIFHIAVMHRHAGVYNLLHEIDGSNRKDIILLKDKSDNNMLHLVGMTSNERNAKNQRASLLMQRELLWFEEVATMMTSYYAHRKNKDGDTPYKLFCKQNEDQVSKGLKWTRDCMVVATLIITVAFAAAFTVPGGYKGENGLPVFIHQRTLLIFVIADAISLFSSSTSLLVFLSVLTSPPQQYDFLTTLPKKLMLGLLTLFISVASMMVTFSANFVVLYHKGLKWVPILIALSATVPIIVFVVFQFHLWVDMFRSAYDDHYLFHRKKRVLYST